MEKIKKIVLEIGKYFKENYSTNISQKTISMLVAVCLIINIVNLPAFASENRIKDNKEKNERVMESGKTSTSEVGLVNAQEAMKGGSGEGVSKMNAIGNMSEEEVNSIIEIDEQNGVIKDKTKGNKVVAVYNAEKEQVLGYAGQSDIIYYQALVNRKKSLEKGGISQKEQKAEEKADKKAEKETVKAGKTAQEIAEVKGIVIGEYKPEEQTTQTATEETTVQKTVKEVPETKETVIETTQKQEENIQTNTTEQNKKEVVEKLSQDTGVNKEEVEKGLDEALKGKTKEEKESVIGLLKTFFDKGGDIINCAVDVLAKVLDVHSKGLLGLQALLVEISTGLFVKNNEELIKSGETQLMTSMSTMQQVMEQYGKEAEGYSTDIENFIAGTKSGESSIVWVNSDHYITVTRLEDGNYGVADSNVKNGESVEYSAEGLKAVLSGKERVDVDGKKVGVSYKAQAEDGTIKVLAVSKGLKQAKEEGKVEAISKKEMVKIKGANTDNDKKISIGNNGATITDSTTGEKKNISFDKNLTEEELEKENQFIKKYGVSAWEEHIRGEGLLKQETLYDKEGNKIYDATKVGYDANSHTIALKYDFFKAYTDDIYFINSQSTKLLVQSYKTDAATGLLKEDVAMVYAVASNASAKEYTFENGITVTMAISNIDRIVEKGEFVEKDEKDDTGKNVKKTYQEYRAIDYSNGNNINNGIPTGLEYIKVSKDGQKDFIRYELANSTIEDSKDSDEKAKSNGNKQAGKESGSKDATDEDNTTKEYKEILEKTAQLKVKDNDIFYVGYKYVSDKYITGVISYSTKTQQYVRSCKVGDLDITAQIEGVGDNWRYLKSLSKGAKISLQSKGKDINGKDVVYMATAELTEDSVWEDIDKNLSVNNENIVICGYTKDDKGNIVYDPCYRVSGKYSATKGFYGADLGEYSDYYTSIKTGDDESIQIYNIKRTADGKYVAQQNSEDEYVSTYYTTKEKSPLKIKKEDGSIELGEEREREVMYGINAGIVFEKNEKGDVILKDGDKILTDESGNVDLKSVSKQSIIFANEQDMQDIADYYSEEVTTKTEKTASDWAVTIFSFGVASRTTTTTTYKYKYATWNPEKAEIEYHTKEVNAKENNFDISGRKTNQKVTVKDDGETTLNETYKTCKGDGICETFEQFSEGKVDFNDNQMRFLNDVGMDIKNYTERTEHRVDITINNVAYKDNGTVQICQNIRSYRSNGSYIIDSKNPLSVQTGMYYTINGIQSPNQGNGFIYNAKGICSRVDYDYKSDGSRIVVGYGNFAQNAFIGGNMCVATMITNGTYYGAKTQLDENDEIKKDDNGDTIYETDENGKIIYSGQSWMGMTNYSSNAETVIGEWFNSLSKEDKEKMRITIPNSDGEDIILQLHYEDGELTYQAVGDKQLSEYTFNKTFSGNEGDRSFSINSIGFDSSQGFYVDVGLQLTQKEFKVTGSTVINSGDSDEEGDAPKEVKDKKYSVAVSIDGENMILKATDDGSKHEVSISFGLNELTSGSSVIENYSFGYFYAGTEITFYEQENKIIESENIGRKDVSNLSTDAGDIIYQKITVMRIENGSKVLLTTNTGLGELAVAIVNNGFKEGSGNVINEITFERDSKHVEHVKIEAKMEKSENWEKAKKIFYIGYETEVKSVDSTGTVKTMAYSIAEKGDKMLGGKYDGKGKVKISFWKGSIDFYSSATQITVKRNGFVKGLLTAAGIILSTMIFNFPPLLKVSASLLKDKKIENVTKGEMLSAGIAGIAAIAIIVIAVVGVALSPFTFGGGALAAAIAITAITTAFTTYFGAKAAFDASEGYQMYAKTGNSDYLKEAILNTFIFVISAISAFGIGSSAAGIVNSFTTGTLKTALYTGLKYALIGAGVGTGVGAAVSGIKSAINKEKFKFFTKEMGIGALTGFFIGFSLGFSIGASTTGVKEANIKNFVSSKLISFKSAGVLAKIGKVVDVAIKAVDTFITVVMARNMIDSCINGDIDGAISSLYVMFSINVINPMLSEANKVPETTKKDLKFGDVLKKTSGAYKSVNGNLVYSGTTLARSIIMGVVGFGAGYGLGLLLNKFKDGDGIIPFVTATLLALAFYGASSAIATGGYGNLKFSNITEGLRTISVKTFQMTNRMLQFNLELQYFGALIGLIRHAAGGKKLSEDNSWWGKFIRAIDNFTGFGVVSSAEALIYDEEGNFSKSTVFNREGVNESAINSLSGVLSPSMLLFSAGTTIFMPLLNPALMNSPILGMLMQYINKGMSWLENQDFLNTFCEEGFREKVSGIFFGKALGESTEASEILQELLDDTPDANFDMDFLESESSRLGTERHITEKSVKKAANLIEKARKNDSKRNEIINNNKVFECLSNDVFNSLIDGNKKYFVKGDVKNITDSLAREVVMADIISQKVISPNMVDTFRVKLNTVKLEGLSFIQMANYIYGLACVYASNNNVDFNNLTENTLKDISTKGLLHLFSVYGRMDNEGKMTLAIGKITKERIGKVVDEAEKYYKNNADKPKAIFELLNELERQGVGHLSGEKINEIKTIVESINQINKQIERKKGVPQLNNDSESGMIASSNIEQINNEEADKLKEQLKRKERELDGYINTILKNFGITTQLLNAIGSQVSVKWALFGDARQEYDNFKIKRENFVEEAQNLSTRISDIMLKSKFERIKEDVGALKNEMEKLGENIKEEAKKVFEAKKELVEALNELATQKEMTATEFFRKLALVDANEMTLGQWLEMKSDDKLKNYREKASNYRKALYKYIQNIIDSDFRLQKGLSNKELILLKSEYLSKISTMGNKELLFSLDFDISSETSVIASGTVIDLKESIRKKANLVDEQTIKEKNKELQERCKELSKKIEITYNEKMFTDNNVDISYNISELYSSAPVIQNRNEEEEKNKQNYIAEAQEIFEQLKINRIIEKAVKAKKVEDYNKAILELKGMGLIESMIAKLESEKESSLKKLSRASIKGFEEKVNNVYASRKTEIEKMSAEKLMFDYLNNTKQNTLITQSPSNQIMEKLYEQYVACDKNNVEYEAMKLFFDEGGIFDLLKNSDYGKNLIFTENQNIKAKQQIKKVFELFANNYWNKFDYSIEAFINDYNKKHIENKIIATQQLREVINSGNNETIKNLKDGMIKTAFGENKTDKNLTFTERLALDLKFSEIASGVWKYEDGQLQAYEANNKGTEAKPAGSLAKAYSEEENIEDYGYGFLGANSKKGTNTGNQVLMLCNNLLGRVSSVPAGGGKTFVYAWTIDQVFNLNLRNQLKIAEIFGAKSTDSAQLSGAGKEDVMFMWSMMQIKVVNGEQQYQSGTKDGYKDLIHSYTDQIYTDYKGIVITYSLGQRTFVELQARKNNRELNKALNKVMLRIVDEADVAAISKMAFILGIGDKTVDKLRVKYTIECLQDLQKIVVNGEQIKANTKAKTKEDLAEHEFAVIDGKVVCADELEKLILKKFKDKIDTDIHLPGFHQFKNYLKKKFTGGEVNKLEDLGKYKGEVEVSQVMRAMCVMRKCADNMESVAFVNGQPASIQAGSQSNNTTDQSSTYNVTLVALKVQELIKAENKNFDISKMKIEDYHYGKGKNKYDVNNVKISVSSGESTISQIFSRNQSTTLNFGGSATLAVVREIAQVIFGGLAVDIESSSIKKFIGQYNKEGKEKRFKVVPFEKQGELTAREQIINKAVTSAVEFLKGANQKIDSKGNRVGLLFGAMDMSYNAEVMIKALAELSNGNFTYQQIIDATKGKTLTQILNYISDNYENMKQYTKQIQIIDADVAGNNSDAVVEMSQKRGMLTFSNESGLRGVDFKSIDMIILDGHNFPSSDLLQAIGRPGRNQEWGKDRASVDVYMDKDSIKATIDKMIEVDEYLQRHKSKRLFNDNDVTGENNLKFNDIIAGNIMADDISDIDSLEVVSTFNSMQLKSESILFKARQESMYILVKEPLAEMAAKARAIGDIEGEKYLMDLYYKSISNDEGNLFEKDIDKLSNPMTTIIQIYSQVLKVAETYLTLAQDHKFKDKSINIDIVERLLDIKSNAADGAFQKLIDTGDSYFSSTFAQASRKVDLVNHNSPAQDLAKVLIKLSEHVLPTATFENNTSTVVMVEDAIKTESMTEEQKKEADKYKAVLETDTTLSYENRKGKKVLTEKGKIYAFFVNKQLAMPSKEWIDFINSLLEVNKDKIGYVNESIGKISKNIKEYNSDEQKEILNKFVNVLWDNKIKDSKAVENLFNSYQMIDSKKYNEFTIEKLQQIINIKYESGLDKYIKKISNKYSLPPEQTVWLAKSDFLSNKTLQKTIVVSYDEIKDTFDKQQKSGIIINQKLKGEFGILVEKIKTGVPFVWYKFVNWCPLVNWWYWGYIGELRRMGKKLNPELAYILDKEKTKNEEDFVNDIKSKMTLAGIEINENTDMAIKNMKGIYSYLEDNVVKVRFKNMGTVSKIFSFVTLGLPFGIKALRAKSKLKEKFFRLNNIKIFADMPQLIKTLLEKNRIKLQKKEKSILESLFKTKEDIMKENIKLKGKNNWLDNFLKEEKTEANTIGRMKKVVEENKGKDDAENILKIAFKTLYPAKDTQVLIERYKYIIENFQFATDVLDDMSISEIADDNNFVDIENKKSEENLTKEIKAADKKIATTEKFNNKYKEAIQGITIDKLNEIEKSELNKFKDTKLKEFKKNELEKFKKTKLEKSKENNDKNLNDKKIEQEFEENFEKKLKQKFENDFKQNEEKDFEKDFEQELKNRDIKYNDIVKNNYDNIVNYVSKKLEPKKEEKQKEEVKEEPKEEQKGEAKESKEEESKEDKKVQEKTSAQKMVETFTIKDLSNAELIEQLKNVTEKGIITLDEKTTRETIIKDIKQLTPKQILKGFVSVDAFIKENEALLEMAGFNVKGIKENRGYIKGWVTNEKSNVVKEFGNNKKIDLEFYLSCSMEDLSELKPKKATFKKYLYSKKVAEMLKEELEKKTYSQLMATDKTKKVFGNLKSEEQKDFLAQIGLDHLIDNKNKLEEELKNKLNGNKEENKEINESYSEKKYKDDLDGLVENREIKLVENREIKMDSKYKDDENIVKKSNKSLEERFRNWQIQRNNQKVKTIIDNIKVKDLNDNAYISATTDLLKAEIITPEDIKEGKEKVKEVIKGKKYVELAKKLEGGESKAEEVLKATGMSNAIKSIEILKTLKGVSTKKLYDITMKNMTIKDLLDKKTADIDIKELDIKANDLIEKTKTDEDIEKMTLNKEEAETIKAAKLKKEMEKGAGEKTKMLNAVTQNALIAAISAKKSYGVPEEKSAFANKNVAGLENIKTNLKVLMKATGTESVQINENAIKEGMMLVLEDNTNKDNTHVITVMKVKGNKIVYAKNVRGKKDIIKATVAMQDLKKGVTVAKDGALVSSNNGEVKFGWKGLVLATDGMITTVKQEMDVEMMKLSTAVENGITGAKKDSIEVKAIAKMLGKDNAGDLEIGDIAKVFEIDTDINETKEEDIKNSILTRISCLSVQGNTANVELAIELTAVAGGLLLAMKKQDVKKVSDLKQATINADQQTITDLLMNEYRNFDGRDNFMINLDNLHKAVEDKITYTSEKRKEILHILAENGNALQINNEDANAVADVFKLQYKVLSAA